MDWSVEEGHPLGELLYILAQHRRSYEYSMSRGRKKKLSQHVKGFISGLYYAEDTIRGFADRKVHGRREGITGGEED